MDELALCQSIARIVTERAAGRRVARIHLQVGRLRDVEPDTLLHCWSIVSQDPSLEGSVLDVESVKPGIVCRSCMQDSTVEPPVGRCPICGAAEIRLVHGEELRLTTLELVEALPSPPGHQLPE